MHLKTKCTQNGFVKKTALINSIFCIRPTSGGIAVGALSNMILPPDASRLHGTAAFVPRVSPLRTHWKETGKFVRDEWLNGVCDMGHHIELYLRQLRVGCSAQCHVLLVKVDRFDRVCCLTVVVACYVAPHDFPQVSISGLLFEPIAVEPAHTQVNRVRSCRQ